ncbi:hypothetical protein [Lelliottia amnigena]|uniref:hypothetical protein n=1 Tax=Lelliottia amnigena TaxID=61646 RepID=UPI004055ECEC
MLSISREARADREKTGTTLSRIIVSQVRKNGGEFRLNLTRATALICIGNTVHDGLRGRGHMPTCPKQ